MVTPWRLACNSPENDRSDLFHRQRDLSFKSCWVSKTQTMKTLKLITFPLLYLAVLFNSPIVAHSGDKSSVWYWFEDCTDKKMNLEVMLDGNTIYNASFPTCKKERSLHSKTKKQKVLEFRFVPTRTITWEGYLDEDNTTKVGQEIEGNIWLSGSESEGLILGVSFMSNNQIFMNSVHFARMGSKSDSEIVSGLLVTTTLRTDNE